MRRLFSNRDVDAADQPWLWLIAECEPAFALQSLWAEEEGNPLNVLLPRRSSNQAILARIATHLLCLFLRPIVSGRAIEVAAKLDRRKLCGAGLIGLS